MYYVILQRIEREPGIMMRMWDIFLQDKKCYSNETYEAASAAKIRAGIGQ